MLEAIRAAEDVLAAHHAVAVHYEPMQPSDLADWDSTARVLRVNRDGAAQDQLWVLTELCVHLLGEGPGSADEESME